MKPNCAILLFTQSASADAVSKNLLPGKAFKHKKNLSSILITDCLKKLQQTGLPVFCTNGNQAGNSFGEKISNGLEQVFNKGFEQVVVVGNDCPELTTRLVLESVTALNNCGAVIGPDRRGGAYLIGINQNAFDKNLFAGLPWQSGGLFTGLQNLFLINKSSFTVLKTCSDINCYEDLHTVAIKFKTVLLQVVCWCVEVMVRHGSFS